MQNVLALAQAVATFLRSLRVPVRRRTEGCSRFWDGELAQLVERDNGIVEVTSSTLVLSTISFRLAGCRPGSDPDHSPGANQENCTGLVAAPRIWLQIAFATACWGSWRSTTATANGVPNR